MVPIANIAKEINSKNFDDGRVQCVEVEIESACQLADVLKSSSAGGVYVFRGSLGKVDATRLASGEAKTNQLASGDSDTDRLTSCKAETKRVTSAEARIRRLVKQTAHRRDGVQAVFLNLSKLNKITEHVKGDQVLSVETGSNLKSMNDYLSNHGQWLPVEYHSSSITLSDLVETGDGGYLEPFNGTMKHLVLGMELATTEGEIIKTGGKIVKNVTGYDLSKMFVGSRNWLAVPYLVHLRLFSKPDTDVAFVVSASKPDELITLANKLRATGLPAYSLEAMDGRVLAKCLRELGTLHRQGNSDRGDSEGNSVRGHDEGNSVRGHDGGNSDRGEPAQQRAELLKALERFQTDGDYLIVSTRGHEEDATEVARALRSAAALTGLTVEEISCETANKIQRLCSEIFEVAGLPYVELSMPASRMSYFFQTAWLSGKPLWAARPTSGRLRIAFDTERRERDQEEFLNQIEQFASTVNTDGRQPLTVAYSDEQAELVVKRSGVDPAAQLGVEQILNRLKSKYDPNGVLNPLVKFL